jgi:protein-tyrosine-phosphatase
MASEIFKRIAAEKDRGEEWRVESAGTWALEGYPASEKARMVLKSRGMSADDHISRGVTQEMLSSFDLILTMEEGHKEALRVEFPQLADRIYLLSEMVDQRHSVRDPINGTLADFEETADVLESLLRNGFDRIKRIAEDNALK